jgi:beta-lactamase regulating signal transducer with metallopeptidase domain
VAWFLTWLVQGAALCAVTAALVRLPGFRARAAARAAAWSVALAGMAALALLPLLPELPADAGAAASPAHMVSPDRAPGPFVLPAVTGNVLVAGLAIWFTGALASLGWAAREICRVVRLKRGCEPWADDELVRVAPDVASTLSRRCAKLRWCDELDGPSLLGFGSPVIAIPRAHGARLSDEALRHVLLHEAAHLRRRDDWAALMELIVAGMLWVNPFVHVARRSIALAREMACDDRVVRQTAAPAAYARCLTTVADLRRTRRRSALAAAATGKRSVLTRRVTRVLEADRRPGARASRLFALMTPVVVGALAIAMIQAPPLVVDGPILPAAIGSATRAGFAATGPAMTVPQGAVPVPAPGPTRRTDDRRNALGPVAGPAAPIVAEVARPEQGVPGRRAAEDIEAQAAAALPLNASPLPGAGAPGVPAADGPVAASTMPSDNSPWWGRAARVGSATSEEASAAGRVTASFFRRLGSSVSQSLTR